MDNKFAKLFEPVQIGPVLAPNRFYQVPHCNGMGYRMPHALAAMRGVKAEGGWGVVCTEEVEIHHSSDLAPNIEGRLWDDQDIPGLALMAEAVHEHGALAGIELTYSGHHAVNYYSRAVAYSPRSLSSDAFSPGQTRSLDKEDIRNIRRWHRSAAMRAKKAGYDIIYCYAAHNLSLAMHFLLHRYNDRTDEYGGSLENRVRFLKELIEDTREAVGGSCAVAVRLAVDELLGEEGLRHQNEGYEIIAMLAELPDLWDVNISDWSNDSASSRFKKEGYQERYTGFVKSLTSKPVVGVGRYTTPEAMLTAVEKGIVDFIGSGRPSIADPFLPQKIKEGRTEDIRECIGCNICVSADELSVPIRCTQNPTMGEEWRRSWHPETIVMIKDAPEVLVVGAGPAGLECTRALGQRGCRVILVEAEKELGGRLALESALPGLAEWRRVIDWRLTQIGKLDNVSVYPSSPMKADDILEAGIKNVIIATGAAWRRDGIGRHHWQPLPGWDSANVFSPDDLMHGKIPEGEVVVFDDDHYYMGSVLAQLLVENDCRVCLVTPAPQIAFWSQYTLEQGKVQDQLVKMGVSLYTQHLLQVIQTASVTLSDQITKEEKHLSARTAVLVTDRISNDGLYYELKPALANRRLVSLELIGDALAPNIIAQAVFSGHLAAREFGQLPTDETPFRREFSYGPPLPG